MPVAMPSLDQRIVSYPGARAPDRVRWVDSGGWLRHALREYAGQGGRAA